MATEDPSPVGHTSGPAQEPVYDGLHDRVHDPSRLAAVERTGLLDAGPQESFERIGSLARRLTGAPTALVSLVAADRQYFTCCLGLPEPWSEAGETPLTHSICQYVLDRNDPLVIPDTATDARLADNRAVDELGVAAYLGIPLVGSGGHVLGSFCVLDDRPRDWSADDVSVMTDLAASVMAEIELRQLVEEREQQAAALARSESRLRATMNGLFIFAGLLDVDGTLIDANTAALGAAGLALDDVVGRPFWEAYWWSWDESVQRRLRHAIERAAEGELSRYDVEVRLADDVFVPIDFQLAPLIEDGQVVRLIPSGLDITQRKRFEQELQRMAEVESAHRRRAEDLLELSRSLNAAVGTDEIAGVVATIGSKVAGSGFCNIGLVLDGGDELELRHGPELDSEIGESWPRVPLDTTSPLGAAVVTGASQLLSDPAEIRHRFPIGAADTAAAGFRALAAVPVPGNRAAVGFAWPDPVVFTPTVVDTLDLIADLTGQALPRGTVHERDRAVAERLQRSLLPAELPSIPGAEIASRYLAGAAGMEVGGDWYDVGELGPDRWVLAIGDVVGRGLNAASIMGQLRSSFTALAATSADITRLIDRLDLAAGELDESVFSTMVAVEYRCIDGAITAVSAGHPPPFIRRWDGRVEQIDGQGRPIGVSQGDDRIARSNRLGPGDLLVLYTDGLVERRGVSIDAGLGRLADALADVDRTAGVAEIADELIADLEPEPDDDVALLVLQVDPS